LNYSEVPTNKQYDYIIGGAGLSGLTLALKLFESGLLKEKTLLLIDPNEKSENDRTWSFWAKNKPGLTNLPTNKSWNKALIKSTIQNKVVSLSPYVYYNINGLSYYDFVKERLKAAKNIEWLLDEIKRDNSEEKTVYTKNHELSYNSYFFKSHFYPDEITNLISQDKRDNFFLWQDFLGYRITFDEAKFDVNQFTYMDLTVPQHKGALCFVYVLPFTENTALVEYTIFGKEQKGKAYYKAELETYISEHFGSNYKVKEEEYNKIPMSTSIKIARCYDVIPIGTLAGAVKASTGYSFLRNQWHANHIVEQLKKGSDNFRFPASKRHTFYDKVMINVIASYKAEARNIYEVLYAQDLKLLFKFLDEETTIWEDIKIMRSVPTWPFVKGVWASLMG